MCQNVETAADPRLFSDSGEGLEGKGPITMCDALLIYDH